MKWFDEMFYREVRRRTRRPVLLLLDNAPGHGQEFTRENVAVKFLPPNVTAWKQPMDMGIIAALKKRYKFLILKDIIGFNDLPATARESMQQAVQAMRRGAAGIEYGKPATLLDAAKYAAEAWSNVSASTIENCFKKANIVPSLRTSNATDDPKNFDDFLSLMRNCSMSDQLDVESLQNEIEYVLHVDDDDNHEYRQEVLEDIDEVILLAEHGIVASESDPEKNEQEEHGGKLSTPGDYAPVELDVVIGAAMALTIEFQKLSIQGTVPEKEMCKCMDDLSRLQHSLKSANSAMIRNRTKRVKQSILDVFFKK
jgi:hypothetical protein